MSVEQLLTEKQREKQREALGVISANVQIINKLVDEVPRRDPVGGLTWRTVLYASDKETIIRRVNIPPELIPDKYKKRGEGVCVQTSSTAGENPSLILLVRNGGRYQVIWSSKEPGNPKTAKKMAGLCHKLVVDTFKQNWPEWFSRNYPEAIK